MILLLKPLGLALFAMLVLSAMDASAALANPKLTPVPEEYPVTVEGTQTGVNVLEMEGGRKTECATFTFKGEVVSKVAAETSELTVKPTYSNCVTTLLGATRFATVITNGCDYLLKTTGTTAGTIAAEGWEVTGGSNEIKCPVGASIEIHVFVSQASDEANETPVCTYKIAAQTLSGDLDYKLVNIELVQEGLFFWWAGTFAAIKSTLNNITVSRTSGTVTNCGAAGQDAVLKGEAKMEWFNKAPAALRGRFED